MKITGTCFLIIEGDAVQTNLDTMCEVLLILNKKYSDNLRRWLHDIVTVQNIILPNVTEDMKSTFFKRVLRLFYLLFYSVINFVS